MSLKTLNVANKLALTMQILLAVIFWLVGSSQADSKAATLALAPGAGVAPAVDKNDLGHLFAGKNGCLALYNLKSKAFEQIFNEPRCREREVMCSTFKVPLSLMAVDRGLIKDEKTSFKWDGTRHSITEWNSDQTAATWMRDSTIWVSQELTPKIGSVALRKYLSDFKLGNEDMSGGLRKFWLASTLKISPIEQIKFWERFWNESLTVSTRAFAVTKKILPSVTSMLGPVLHGKTGSGKTAKGKAHVGWYVAHLSSRGEEYLIAVDFAEPAAKDDDRPGGPIAKEIAIKALSELGLF